MKRRYMSAVILAVTAVAVSACTPPLPPDVAAAYADQYFNCVAGSVRAHFDASTTDAGDGWIADNQDACGDAVDVQATTDAATPADLYLNKDGVVPATCTPAVQVPILVDGVVPVAYFENADSINLTPAVLHDVLTGKITSWGDPAIAALNPDSGLTNEKVVVAAHATAEEIAAFSAWMNRLDPAGWPADTKIKKGKFATADDLSTVDGIIALTSFSESTNNAFTGVGLITKSQPDGFVPDDSAMFAGASQLKATTSGTIVSASLDPAQAPKAAEGLDKAADPWQAITTETMTVCAGTNEMATRGFARNLLRLDAQGALGSMGFQPLPDSVRQVAANLVATGLPTPTALPSANPSDSATPTDSGTPEPSAS